MTRATTYMQSKNYLKLKLKLKPGSTAATTHAEWSRKAAEWQRLRSSSLLLVRTFFWLVYSRWWVAFFLSQIPNLGNCDFKSHSLNTVLPIHERHKLWPIIYGYTELSGILWAIVAYWNSLRAAVGFANFCFKLDSSPSTGGGCQPKPIFSPKVWIKMDEQ